MGRMRERVRLIRSRTRANKSAIMQQVREREKVRRKSGVIGACVRSARVHDSIIGSAFTKVN